MSAKRTRRKAPGPAGVDDNEAAELAAIEARLDGHIEAALRANRTNGNDNAVDDEIKRLAALSAVQYEQQRKDAAEKLGVRASILDKLVHAERPDDEDGQGRAIEIVDEEPWPHPVDGAELADELAVTVHTYVVLRR